MDVQSASSALLGCETVRYTPGDRSSVQGELPTTLSHIITDVCIKCNVDISNYTCLLKGLGYFLLNDVCLAVLLIT